MELASAFILPAKAASIMPNLERAFWGILQPVLLVVKNQPAMVEARGTIHFTRVAVGEVQLHTEKRSAITQRKYLHYIGRFVCRTCNVAIAKRMRVSPNQIVERPKPFGSDANRNASKQPDRNKTSPPSHVYGSGARIGCPQCWR